ncbi:MAG: thioredoxin domain-containing protein [Patescibacteria group bacterium]
MSLNERIKYAAMKARHAKTLRPWYKKWWGRFALILSVLILLLLSFCSIYVVAKIQDIRLGKDSATTEQEIQNYLKNINGNGTNYYLGSASPQVAIIEFGDFACPYSKASAPVIRDLATEYKSKVKLIWRDYLRNSDSIDLAMAARCAGEQNKFWEMHDKLFDQQADLTINNAERITKLTSFAQDLKLNTKKFSSCLADRTYLDQIKKDYDDGTALQIIGTPSWFVNNHYFSGSLSKEKFQELLKGLIK